MSLTDALAAKPPRAARRSAPAPRAITTDEFRRRYALAAMEKEAADVRGTREGERNKRLNEAAFALGQLVGAGVLSEREVWDELTSAAKACKLGTHEIEATIASGLSAGQSNPREIPEQKHQTKNRTSSETSESPEEPWEPTDADAPDAPPADNWQPSDGPLAGLKHLGPIAVIGRAKLEALAAQPIPYVWQDTAVAGTIVLIAGPPGDGKTTLLFLILLARMHLGVPLVLLGRQIKPAPAGQWVVLIEGEHSEASAARKLLKTARILDVDAAALDRVIVVARKAVTLGSPQWADVVTLVARGLVSDIAIDTVARVMPADADNEREQVAIFDAVARAIEAAPVAEFAPLVWAVAHTRKNNTTGELSDVSGSAQRTGQADTVLLLKGERVDGRTVSTKVTFAKLREDPDDYPLPVTFSIAPNREGVPRLILRGESTDSRPLEQRIEELLAIGARTKNALREALSRSDADVDAALTNLFAARRIRTTTLKVNGRARKAFKLANDTDKPDEWEGDFQS